VTGPPIEVCLYSPADLNLVGGSAVWVQAVADTLLAGPRVRLTVPLRFPRQRDLVAGSLDGRDRLLLVEPPGSRTAGLSSGEALDRIEDLDRRRRFDVIIVRSFAACRAILRRRRLADRVWACYVLEPERDPADPAYLADLAAIAAHARYVVVQSEEMRALFETIVPAGRGRTILLPPAVGPLRPMPSPNRPRPPRLVYAGKFHPFYAVDRLAGDVPSLRARFPGLEFHVAGDLFFGGPDDPYAASLRRLLTTTPGVVWHGALSRAGTLDLLAEGGVAVSVWDHRHGSTMNDLVVSTKLLDYCAAGLPVVLTRTAAQETILGGDYPLFVDRLDEARATIERALEDPELCARAAARCRAAAESFACEAVYARVAPWLEDRPDVALRQFDRPKLPGAEWNLGVLLDAERLTVPQVPLEMLATLRRHDARFRLHIGRRASSLAPTAPGADPAASLRATLGAADVAVHGPAISFRTVDDEPNWWRTIGFVTTADGRLGSVLREAVVSGAIPLGGRDETTPSWLAPFAVADLPAAAAQAAGLVERGEWVGRSRGVRAAALEGEA
jgi:glycosyltransferase involved in cell wall biosynthesis